MLTEQEILALPERTKLKVVMLQGNTPRVMYEGDGNVFEFAKGKSKYGTRYSVQTLLNIAKSVELAETPESTEQLWHKRVKRVIRSLEQSGLWPKVLEDFRNLDTMTYSDKNAIYNLFGDYKREYIYIKNPDKEAIRRENERFEKHYHDFISKYPFVFPYDDQGVRLVNTKYIWEKSECHLKSMYFGRMNKYVKERISDALKTKTKYSAHERTGYDVSFEYDPEKQAAWYSEEYRGCGNGHYYIALNENTALFVEDD